MIGIIVTGHGGFAAGMEKNVKMLAGADAQLARRRGQIESLALPAHPKHIAEGSLSRHGRVSSISS